MLFFLLTFERNFKKTFYDAHNRLGDAHAGKQECTA